MQTSLPKASLISNNKGIRQLILKTGLPLNKAPEALGMSSAEFMRWWSSCGAVGESRAQVISLAQYLDISEDQILLGDYDLNLLRSRIFTDPFTLPKKYSANQFSYLRSSAHIYRYLVLTRGQHFADSLARKLNISPLLYQNLDNRISLNYFLDLLDLLKSNGFKQQELDTLAGVLFLGLAESNLFTQFKNSKDYYECYSTLAKNLKMFDENFIYHSDLDKKQYRMTSFLPKEKHNHFAWSVAQINGLLRYRQLLAGWFPYLCGLSPIMPKVSHEFSPDGIKTTYLVTFPSAHTSQLSLC